VGRGGEGRAQKRRTIGFGWDLARVLGARWEWIARRIGGLEDMWRGREGWRRGEGGAAAEAEAEAAGWRARGRAAEEYLRIFVDEWFCYAFGG
jgi:hypothetical protein